MNLEKLTAGSLALVTPADSDLTRQPTIGVWVGGAGNLRVTTFAGEDVVIPSVPAGTLIPIKVKRIWATNTTATLIMALYP